MYILLDATMKGSIEECYIDTVTLKNPETEEEYRVSGTCKVVETDSYRGTDKLRKVEIDLYWPYIYDEATENIDYFEDKEDWMQFVKDTIGYNPVYVGYNPDPDTPKDFELHITNAEIYPMCE